MANKITFSSPSEAKLSWRALYNGQDVTSELDAVAIVINNDRQELDPSASEHVFTASETASVYVAAEWNGFSAKSSKLTAEYVKAPSATYYGTLIINPNSNSHGLSDEELAEAFQTYFDSADLDSLVDSNPIIFKGVTVANPGSLVKSTSIVPTNNRFEFMCAEYNNAPIIEQSRPVVIYPASNGKVSQIIDDLQANSIGDFILTEFTWNGEPYYAYALKGVNALATDDGTTLPYTFKK